MTKHIIKAIRVADLEGLPIAHIEVKHLVALANRVETLEREIRERDRLVELNKAMLEKYEEEESKILDFTQLMLKVNRG